MTREQILEFLNANPLCHLATCEGTQPRVRGMMLYRTEASGLIFHTGRAKALTRQLLANRQVEVCFNSQDREPKHDRSRFGTCPYSRLAGRLRTYLQ